MAERRMISKSILDNDAFYELPLSAQALYFHIVLNADDDGFTGSILKIMRTIGATQQDLDVLLKKRYVLDFPSNPCIVVKHWKCMNSIAKDRYRKTTYTEEMAMLDVDYKQGYIENKGYYEACNTFKMLTKCLQDVNNSETECLHSIVKNSLEKNRLYIYNTSDECCGDKSPDILEETPKKTNVFKPPTLDEVAKYIVDNNYSVDPHVFIDFYDSKGWMVGKNKMKNWKTALSGWNARNKNNNTNVKQKPVVETEWMKDYQQELEEKNKAEQKAFEETLNTEEVIAAAKELFGD